MFRMTWLCLGTAALAQLVPQGCTGLTPSGDETIAARNTILTEATAPEMVDVGETATLAASATADVDGGALAYYWIQVEGAGVSLQNADQATAGFVAPSLSADQTLGFLVTTTNERGDAGRATARVLVLADSKYGESGQSNTTGPIARAGADQTVPAGGTVTLNGTNSRGNTLTYAWRQTSGTTVTLQTADTSKATFAAPAFNASGTNRLEFELEVKDSRSRRATDRIVITVRERTAADDTDSSPRLRFNTSKGSFVVELDRDKAPKTVANFMQYVGDGFYDGTIFHRVIKDFVIQGGGFTPDLVEKETRDPIINESTNGLKNVRGTIAMARTSDPNSATSQFFINLVDNTSLNRTGSDTGYCVFGSVVEGLSVVDAIGAVATGSESNFNDVPLEDVLLQSVEYITKTDTGSSGTSGGTSGSSGSNDSKAP